MIWYIYIYIYIYICVICRSQWPRSLRRRSAATRLLGLGLRITPDAWMSVVRVVCCQVEVSATSWSLVQRSHIDYSVFHVWSTNPSWTAALREKNIYDTQTYRCDTKYCSYIRNYKIAGLVDICGSVSTWIQLCQHRCTKGTFYK
jgi:hypothetical protein